MLALEFIINAAIQIRDQETYVMFAKSDHSLWGYGENRGGQLGDGTKISRKEPVKVADDVAEYCGGQSFLKLNGELWQWGGKDPTPKKMYDNIAYVDGYGNYILTNNNLDTVAYDGSLKILLDDVKIPQSITFPDK